MSPEQRLNAERWLAWVRLGAVPFVILEAAAAAPYPSGRIGWVWASAISFALGAVAFFVLSRRRPSPAALERLGLAALVFDFVVVSSFILSLYFQPTVPIRQVMILVLVEAAFRYGVRGGFVLALLSIPVLIGFEWLRDDYLGQRFRWETVVVQIGIEVVIVLLVGWLVERLRAEATIAQDRVHEAEYPQDELDRRGHVLDAANRCARALGSSLELEEAFGAGNVEARSFGSVLSAAGFLYGLAASDLEPEELSAHDRLYEVIVGVRAVKAG